MAAALCLRPNLIYKVFYRPVTLEEILHSKDQRRLEQKRLLREFPDKTLVVLTVVIPGNIKKCYESEIISKEGLRLLDEYFSEKIIYKDVRDLVTGFEAYFILDSQDKQKIKKKVIEIEDNTSLGRYMDIDVLDDEGIPISRRQMGYPARKCILCDDVARVCMRLGKHSYTEILNKIKEEVDRYVRRI